MKKRLKNGYLPALALGCMFLFGMNARAAGEVTIKNGIYADQINLSGMTAQEAAEAVKTYVAGLEGVKITLLAANNHEVTVTAGELGIAWANPEIVTEALEVGAHGNVIERYKIMKDLEHENLVYDIELSFDLQAINDILTDRCEQYDVEAVDMSLIREKGQFQIVEGRTGYALDVETSIDLINDYLIGDWDRQPCSIGLDVAVTQHRGTEEELSQVKDILGSFTTSYSTSNASRRANVENGCKLIDGVLLYPGDEFSAFEYVLPFTTGNGYYKAPSYASGKVVDSLGGGICQVTTTLYNAVLLSELQITKRYNHSMIVTYVDPAKDAAITQSSNKDFCFVNNGDYPIYIEGYTQNREITFNIYGKETRSQDREVRYESVVLEVNNPSSDTIYADSSHPIGYIVTDSAHVGYKAQLWKVVLENGQEVSRTQVNSSSYNMVPRSATVGVATDDPTAYEEIMAAIGTQSVDHVRNVIAILTAQATVTDSVEVGEE